MRPFIKDLYAMAGALIETKAHDYAKEGDPHSNFKYAAAVAAPFSREYKSYAVLIGVKLARLAELLAAGKSPAHEAVADSFRDVLNYIALFAERHYLDNKEISDEAQLSFAFSTDGSALRTSGEPVYFCPRHGVVYQFGRECRTCATERERESSPAAGN